MESNDKQRKRYFFLREKTLEKYAENGVKSRNNSNSMTSEIIEKARYSNKDITRHELNLVKRHLDLLKRKNGNVTKILTKLNNLKKLLTIVALYRTISTVERNI